MLFHVTTWNISLERCKYDKEWLVKYGWHAHFHNSKGYFTIGWIAFTIDNELKVDNKLLFTITSSSNIIVKVFGTAEVVLSVDDKANEGDSKNDIEEEDIVDDEDYKVKDEEDKDEDDVDDDDDKVVKLRSKNEEHSYQDDDSTVLISSNKDKDDEKLPKNQTPWLHQHTIKKISQNSMVATKSVNYNTNAIQT
jgi:hypothetical protein